MALTVNGNDIKMTEGDFGLQIPINLTGGTISTSDEFKILINDSQDQTTIIEKDYNNVQNNKILFELTEAEAALLPVGSYLWGLDWYQSGAFLDNIIPMSSFKVTKKVKRH